MNWFSRTLNALGWRELRWHQILVLFVLLFLLWFFNGHRILWYAVFPLNKYAVAVVDLEYEGTPFELSGVIQCHWTPTTEFGFLSYKRSSHYVPTTVWLAEKLPDGSAIIANAQLTASKKTNSSSFDLCPFERPSNTAFARLKDKFADKTSVIAMRSRPILYWLDDAVLPTRIEGLFGDTYFEDSKARILFKEYRLEYFSHQPVNEPVEEVPWLDSAVQPGDRGWLGHAAIVIPKESWITDSRYRTATAGVTKISAIEIPQVKFDREAHTVDPSDLSFIRSLELIEGALHLASEKLSPPGMVVFQYFEGNNDPKRTAPFYFDDILINPDQWLTYDPNSGYVFKRPSVGGFASQFNPPLAPPKYN